MNMQRRLANIVGSAIIAASLIAAAPVALASPLSDRIAGLYSTKKSCSEITDFSLAPEVVQIEVADAFFLKQSIEKRNSFLLSTLVLNHDSNAQKKLKELESGELDNEMRDDAKKLIQERNIKYMDIEDFLNVTKDALIGYYKYKRLPVVTPISVYLGVATAHGDYYILSGSFKLNGVLKCIDKNDHLQSLFNEQSKVSTFEEANRFYGKLTHDETLAVDLNTIYDNRTKPFLLYIEATSLDRS